MSTYLKLTACACTIYAFPDKTYEVLTVFTSTYIPNLYNNLVSLIKYKFNLNKSIKSLLNYSATVVGIGSYYYAATKFNEYSQMHNTNILPFFINDLCSLSCNINATSLKIGLIIGCLFPIIRTFVEPIIDDVSRSTHRLLTEYNMIDNIRTLSTQLEQGRNINISYNGVNILSYPSMTETLNEADLETIAPLRYPALHNNETNHLTSDTCAICIGPYSDTQLSRILPCKHSFHASCVDRWIIERSGTCPVCRSVVRLE